MTCPTAVARSMYADGALDGAEAEAIGRHLESCDACATAIAQLRLERRALVDVLAESAAIDHVPPFRRPLEPRHVVIAATAVAAAGWLGTGVWGAFGALVPSELRWLSPLDPGTQLDLLIRLFVYIATEGTAMLDSIVSAVGTAVLASLAVGLAVVLARGTRRAPLALSVLALAVAAPLLLGPQAARAVEIRRGDFTTVGAGETIDDTLVAIGKNVTIDGNVTGDLIAFGQRVTVHGNVGGDVIGGAETVTIDGSVGGSVYGFGASVELPGTHVTRNVYGFGRDVKLGSNAKVDGNAAAFGENLDLGGQVGIDLFGLGQNVGVSAAVQRNLETWANTVDVLAPARIGGNVTAHVGAENDLRVASGATIGGRIDRQIGRGGPLGKAPPRNPYFSVSYYIWQAVRLAAAFLTAVLLLWLVPALREPPLGTGEDWLKAFGYGLITAIALPIAGVILCITIIGIPLGVLAFMLWAVGLYLGKAVVAQAIGVRLFRSPHGVPHYAATLVAGLAIVLVLFAIPFIGGLAAFVVTIAGLGVMVRHAVAHSDRAGMI